MNWRKLTKTFMAALLSAYWFLPSKEALHSFDASKAGPLNSIRHECAVIRDGRLCPYSFRRCFHNATLHAAGADGTLRSRWTELQNNRRQFISMLMTRRFSQTAGIFQEHLWLFRLRKVSRCVGNQRARVSGTTRSLMTVAGGREW